VEIVYLDSLKQIENDFKMMVICNPNNPSTEHLEKVILESYIKKYPSVLFCIDGVFDWYSDWHLSDLVKKYKNLIVLKSFSKIGLAGLRLGYIISSEDVINDVQMGLSPFYVPHIVQLIGLEIIKNINRIAEIKHYLKTHFSEIKNTLPDRVVRNTPLPFYLLKTKNDSTEVTRAKY